MFSPDDRLIVAGYEDSTIKLWDVKNARVLRTIRGRYDDLRAAVISPAGNLIAAGYDSSESRVEIWSVRSGKLVDQLGVDSDYVESIAFARNGTMIATGHFWDDVKLWNARTGKLIRTFKQPFSENDVVAFSPDGKSVVSGGWNQNVLLWNVQQGSVTWSALPLDWETEKRLHEESRTEVASATAAAADEQRKTVAADSEIGAWKKPVTITFDHYGEAINPLEQRMMETGHAEKSLITKPAAEADGVWLRLKNNSPLPIRFRTDSGYLPRRGCAGLCDGAEVSIKYEIEEANGKTVPWGSDMSWMSVLPPGASVLFSVSKSHLENRRKVFVSFSYLKENQEYGTARRVSFVSRKGAKVNAKSQSAPR
jgi:hypothetical protein